MRSSEEILSEAASGHLVVEDEWPRVRDFVLEKLDNIVTSEFPPPPPRASPSKPLSESNAAKQDSPGSQTQPLTQTQTQDNSQAQSVSGTDKENAPPPPPPTSNVSHTSIDFLVRPKPFPSPVEIAQSTHASIRNTLINDFPLHPPHTFQRLAELILYPRREYKYLPSYLQALYRTVSVSSTTEALPLENPAFANTSYPARGFGFNSTSPASLLVNGTGSSSGASSTGSFVEHDDSLGGALLTPIPWFRGSESPEPDLSHDQTPLFETIADPTEAPTNGENEGQILINGDEQMSGTETIDISGNDSSHASSRQSENEADDEEIPHARGPQEIGVEDTGPDPGPGGLASLVAERLGSPPVQSSSTTLETEDPITAMDSTEAKTEDPSIGGSEKMEVETDDSEKKTE